MKQNIGQRSHTKIQLIWANFKKCTRPFDYFVKSVTPGATIALWQNDSPGGLFVMPTM